MKKNIYILVVLFVFSSLQILSQNQTDSTNYINPSPFDFEIYENTSLIKLIANPEKYDGKTLQIVGYLHLEFEGNAVYLHQDDFENGIYENSFWVNFSKKLEDGLNMMNYNDNYVIIIGTFRMDNKGHMGLFGGTIDNIVKLDFNQKR